MDPEARFRYTAPDSKPAFDCLGELVETRMSDPLVSLLQQPLRPRILVVGDVMLDRYVWGDVGRISPEAPIPVLRTTRQEERLGGAGNVASMLAALGVEAHLAAVVGSDVDGDRVRRLVVETIGVDHACLLVDRDRATTLKQRLLGGNNQRYPQQIDAGRSRRCPAAGPGFAPTAVRLRRADAPRRGPDAHQRLQRGSARAT